MKKILLLGDEAIGQGAIDGGISGIYAYPGTPSTEIMEFVQRSKQAKENKIHATWSANEKTAVESALGMSYAGKRAIACMKHVGLNVAADAFINSAITGVNGGLIILVADDPSMHSSQNEQDSRFYGKFSLLPIFEPSNQQEAYEMTYNGFELSEKIGLPILLRITTRLAHSRYGIITQLSKTQNSFSVPKDPKQFILLPAIARKRYKSLLEKQSLLQKISELSSFNHFIVGKDKSLGIVACGISFNYLMENFQDSELPFSVLKISQHPIPQEKIKKLYDESEELLILEDGFPFVEEQIGNIVGIGKKIRGRLTGDLPRDGELNPNLVAIALGIEKEKQTNFPEFLATRPPALCPGCGHIDVYNALNEVMKDFEPQRILSDIGCYTLGALPPYNAINSCVDMGASITMAKGASDAGMFPSIAVIGDSTFTHSGMTGLLDAVNDKSNIVVIILDNSLVGMTGGQKASGDGKIDNICLAIGVEKEHLKIVVPLRKNHELMKKLLLEEINYNGVSVIIARRECVTELSKKKKLKVIK